MRRLGWGSDNLRTKFKSAVWDGACLRMLGQVTFSCAICIGQRLTDYCHSLNPGKVDSHPLLCRNLLLERYYLHRVKV
jgi:hypothetical protein